MYAIILVPFHQPRKPAWKRIRKYEGMRPYQNLVVTDAPRMYRLKWKAFEEYLPLVPLIVNIESPHLFMITFDIIIHGVRIL